MIKVFKALFYLQRSESFCICFTSFSCEFHYLETFVLLCSWMSSFVCVYFEFSLTLHNMKNTNMAFSWSELVYEMDEWVGYISLGYGMDFVSRIKWK